jgi:hypothetical protein
MKLKTKIIALLALASSALVIPANAAVTFTAGDLILAVRGVAEAKTYMVNLGAATTYRDATADNTSVVTVLTDLNANFGTNWNTRSDVFWGIFGVRDSDLDGGTIAGDPGQTIYVSRSEVPVGVQETPWGVSPSAAINNTNHGSAAGSMLGIQQNFATGTQFGLNNATVLADSATLYDTIGVTWGAFTGGAAHRGNFGAGTAGTALDLFRSVGGEISGPGVRQGSYEGTFHISDLGVVGYSVAPTFAAIPEPSRALLLGLSATGLLFRRRRTAQVA